MEIKSGNQFFPLVFRLFQETWLAMAFALFLILNVVVPLGSFEKTKAAVLSRLSDPYAHLEVAEVAAEARDWELARSEFECASFLVVRSRDIPILGLTSRFEEVGSHVFVERTIREEIGSLVKVLDKHPNYRDVYLRISLLFYQLADDKAAVSFWKQAVALDPNNVEVYKVGLLLGKTI